MILSHALRTGDLASVKEANDAGADVNARGPDGLTPLMIASALGQAQAVACSSLPPARTC